MTDDPFSPEADPYYDEKHDGLRLNRRQAAGLIAALPVLASATGCFGTKPPLRACESLPGDPYSCRSRFCRYYRGEDSE